MNQKLKDRNKITRRKLLALLATTLGGAAALKLLNNSNLSPKTSLIEIPEVRAEGEPVLVGGEYTTATSRTLIRGEVEDSTHGVIEGICNPSTPGNGVCGKTVRGGAGIYGWSDESIGVMGCSENSYGVVGLVDSDSYSIFGENLGNGRGIYGMSEYGDGVCGFNHHLGVGVQGFGDTTPDRGPTGTGVRGVGSKTGVKGESSDSSGYGVQGTNSAGVGVYGESTDTFGTYGYSVNGIGVYGESPNDNGIFGSSTASLKNGVLGENPNGTGVRGSGSIGVSGESINGRGIFGKSSSGRGVYGESISGNGVRGTSTSAAGTVGTSTDGFGVRGDSTNSFGVRGSSVNNIGVYGETGSNFSAIEGKNTGSGIGIKAESTSGTALHVEGNNFFKSAQRTMIPTGVRSHDITVPTGITIDTNAMIFVTIMNNSSNIGVRWVERLSDTQFKIHLTGLSRNPMNIGYFIVN
jgi:hypothetical protein